MLFIAKQVIDAVGAFVLLKALVFGESPVRIALVVLAHLLIQSPEEQVLQNALVVAAGIGLELLQDLLQIGFVEQLFRD